MRVVFFIGLSEHDSRCRLSPSEASAAFLRPFPHFFLQTPFTLYDGNRCSQELIPESRASAAYATVTLSLVADAASSPESMAQQADDHVHVCCQVPDETVAAVSTDTNMFGTTSSLFSGLVENVPIDAVVKESKTSHIAVVGPNGFQLCSFLQALRCGLPYRHTVAALVTELKRAKEFRGESIHPRWRSSLQPWSIDGAGLSDFNGHERGPYAGAGTGYLEDIECREEEGTSGNNSAVSVIRGKLLANMVEMAWRAARKLADNLDEEKVLSSDCTFFFARLERNIDAYVKGAASVSTGGLSGILVGNPPMPDTKSRRESRFKDCTEGHASKKARVGPAE